MDFLLSFFQCGTSASQTPLSEPDLPYYPPSATQRRQPGSPVPDLQATPSGSSKSTTTSGTKSSSNNNVLSSRDVLDNMARESGNTNRQGIFDLDRILQACASHDTVFTDEDDDSVVEHERTSLTSCEKPQGAIRQSPGVTISTSPSSSCHATTPPNYNSNQNHNDYHVRIRMSPPREGHALRPLKYHSYDGEDADLVLRRTISESRSELPLPAGQLSSQTAAGQEVARE
eukprot:Nitzschia sp. Nitz4//NODE_542_length_12750_cov_80.145333//3442//4131//NITZ4_additional_000081-RA//-1//CDS//3329531973//941//frame0